VKILVTGGTGFIGGALVQRLTRDGRPVRALVRSLQRAAPLEAWGAELSLGDLRDAASLQAAVRDVDVVVHAAAWVGAGGDPAAIEAVNVTGTQALLDAAAAGGVRRLVHISSTGVYGAPPGLNINEDQPMRLSGLAYHDSKVRAEERVRDETRLETIRLRPSHVWGPASTHFTMRPLRMVLKGVVPLIGGGRFHFKPLHIDNLLDAIALCLDGSAPGDSALNLTDGGPVPWRTLFEGCAAAAGVPLRSRSIPLPVARFAGMLGDGWTGLTGRSAPLSGETVRVLSSTNSYDNARARRVLEWEPQTSWQDGMDGIARWISRHGGPGFLTGPSLPAPLEVL
jgi:2-alkyl-3-oxoalkanoate reductase